MSEYRQHSYQAPAGATEVLLVRHGESRAASADNPFPLVDGHGDPELHPNGEQQAIMVGERLRHETIAAIYVSNLRRTQQTAAPLSRHLNLQPKIDPDLREVFLGEWEGGVMRIRAAAGDPIFTQMQEQQRWDVIPGGESWDNLNTRLLRGLGRIHAAHPNEKVVAVVHGGVIGHLVAHASGAQPFAFNGADNGSITHLVVHGEQIKVRSFNDNTHVQTTLHDGSGQLT
ncbi:MAG: histidine phosphatase family protein [Gammaproteobacteria bacterium TMED92]|nr:MAG: histidine phosphatase family protein [Gammaproteobacteria bacterium TMED92]